MNLMKVSIFFRMALLNAILQMFFNRKEIETMDVIYATLIQEGYKTINDVKPESMREKVRKILITLGLPELANPTE